MRISPLLLVAFVAGCGGEPAVELPAVEGIVTLDDRPLPRGTVSLRPDGENPTEHHPTGMIGPDGRYTIYTAGEPGAPVGRYRVLVFANEEVLDDRSAHPSLPKSIVPARYRAVGDTPLEIEVLDQPQPGRYDLRLTTTAR